MLLHDAVIGTFNVESPEPRAFSESDLQFLEIFCRDVAAALNTLELLVAEKVTPPPKASRPSTAPWPCRSTKSSTTR